MARPRRKATPGNVRNKRIMIDLHEIVSILALTDFGNIWYNIGERRDTENMPTIISQIEKLSLEDQLKLMHWIEKAIKNGRQMHCSTVKDFSFLGCWVDSRSDKEIIDDIESARTPGREVSL